eukprot:29533_1
MMFAVYLWLHLFCFTISYPLSYGTWQTGGSAMPLSNYKMAAGYDATNHTIWLLGGSAVPKQLLSFNTQTLTFVVQNQTGLSHNVLGNQYFTQVGNILWMINPEQDQNLPQGFSTFNVITSQFQYEYNNIFLPVNTGETAACLASTIDANHSYLFVVGGESESSTALNSTQIYNISSDLWLINVPSMDTNRARLSCIAHNNKLYSIGGFSASILDSIEMLDVSTTNLHGFATTWQYIDPLNTPLRLTSAVRYMDSILVIGGYTGQDSSNAIHVIDTISDTVTYYSESLATAVYATAPVVIDANDGTLIAFGGSSSGSINTWQYTELPTWKSKVACGPYDVCYSVDVVPVATDVVSYPVSIQSDFCYEAESYHVTFVMTGNVNCTQPTIDFSFERIDNDVEAKDLIIGYPDPNTHIAHCGNVSNDCNSFHPCFSDYTIATQIDAGRNITVTVMKDAMIQPNCDPDHSWCVNAILTLNCDDTSTSPTTDPTSAPSSPTVVPTVQPTAPTIDPTQAPTRTTATPTLNPSDHPTAPTTQPTLNPTKSPTPTDIYCDDPGIVINTDGDYAYFLLIEEPSIVRFDTCHTLHLFDIFIQDMERKNLNYSCIECGSICDESSQYQERLYGWYRMDIHGPHAFQMI